MKRVLPNRAQARDRSGSRRGFTLIELLISAAVFLVILGAVYLVYTTSHTTYARGETRAEVHQTTRAAMDLMVREIRMAGYWCNPTCPGGIPHPIQEAQASALKIYGDIEGTNTTRIYVAYYVKDNDDVRVGEACPAGKVCTLYRRRYDDLLLALLPEEQLATNVQQLTFRFFDKDGTELVPGANPLLDGLDGAPLQWTNFPSIIAAWANRDAVRRIKVRLLIKGDPDKNIPTYELTMDISPRNLGV